MAAGAYSQPLIRDVPHSFAHGDAVVNRVGVIVVPPTLTNAGVPSVTDRALCRTFHVHHSGDVWRCSAVMSVERVAGVGRRVGRRGVDVSRRHRGAPRSTGTNGGQSDPAMVTVVAIAPSRSYCPHRNPCIRGPHRCPVSSGRWKFDGRAPPEPTPMTRRRPPDDHVDPRCCRYFADTGVVVGHGRVPHAVTWISTTTPDRVVAFAVR